MATGSSRAPRLARPIQAVSSDSRMVPLSIDSLCTCSVYLIFSSSKRFSSTLRPNSNVLEKSRVYITAIRIISLSQYIPGTTPWTRVSCHTHLARLPASFHPIAPDNTLWVDPTAPCTLHPATCNIPRHTCACCATETSCRLSHRLATHDFLYQPELFSVNTSPSLFLDARLFHRTRLLLFDFWAA